MVNVLLAARSKEDPSASKLNDPNQSRRQNRWERSNSCGNIMFPPGHRAAWRYNGTDTFVRTIMLRSEAAYDCSTGVENA
jgi:hypothetical protein